MLFEVEVYRCDICGEVVSFWDIDEHCLFCENTVDGDWTFLGKWKVEAETLSQACDKAIELAKEKLEGKDANSKLTTSVR